MDRALFAIIAGGAALLIGAANASVAQEPDRPGNPLVPRITAAGAFDLRNAERRQPMYLGMTSLEWNTRMPGVALRLDGVYAGRREDLRFRPLFEPGAPVLFADTYRSRLRAQGLFAGVTYELVRSERFRPYVQGGLGIARTQERSETGVAALCADAPCATANWVTTPTTRTERSFTGAAQVGVGAAYRLPWVSIIAETRYFAVPNGNARGLNGAFPLALGIRF